MVHSIVSCVKVTLGVGSQLFAPLWSGIRDLSPNLRPSFDVCSLLVAPRKKWAKKWAVAWFLVPGTFRYHLSHDLNFDINKRRYLQKLS